MSDQELRNQLINEMLETLRGPPIPGCAFTVQDLMRGTDEKKGMSESKAWRMLRKLHAEGKLERAKGPSGGHYYWPVEVSDN